MRFTHSNICDVCGKRKGGRSPIDHSECAKKHKAAGGFKNRQKRKTLNNNQIDYLAKLGG